MFARSVTMRLKPNTVSEFNKTLEKEVLPLLQKQTGNQEPAQHEKYVNADAPTAKQWDISVMRHHHENCECAEAIERWPVSKLEWAVDCT